MKRQGLHTATGFVIPRYRQRCHDVFKNALGLRHKNAQFTYARGVKRKKNGVYVCMCLRDSLTAMTLVAFNGSGSGRYRLVAFLLEPMCYFQVSRDLHTSSKILS